MLEMISPPYGQLRRMCGIGSSIVSAAFSTHTMTNYYYYYYYLLLLLLFFHRHPTG